MPTTTCCNTCDETQTINVPGSAGSNAYTTTTGAVTVAAAGNTTTVNVGSTAWMAIGQKVFVSDGTKMVTFEVQSIGGSTSFVGEFMGYVDDSASGTIASGAAVVPSGAQSTFTTTALKALNATLLTGIGSFTDNTTGSSSDTLAAGVGVQSLAFFVNLAQITATTIMSFTPGFAFKVLAIQFSSEIAVTTAAKAATITPYINGVSTTGGALALTSANCTPKGTTVTGSTITAGNTGTSAQTLALVASTVTAFSEGSGWIILRVQNMDSANATASLAAKINTIKAALQT